MIEIESRKYPFGGACNRYYNIRHHVSYDIEKLDLVSLRQKLVFETHGVPALSPAAPAARPRVGLNRSFLVNTYYPLYSRFFSELGFDIVLPDLPSQEGIDQRGAAFCYPVELAHGFFDTLLKSESAPDFIFLPHFKAVPNLDKDGSSQSQVCPLAQGETYYLQTAFRQALERLNRLGTRLITPLIDLSQGMAQAEKPLLEAARQMGIRELSARGAFAAARLAQRDCFAAMSAAGRSLLAELEADPERIGVIVFARPYNGYAEEAHMGIPHKFASRGIPVIPLDFLDFGQERSKRHMYWGTGKLIMKAARWVEKHPQLFGTFITNFSCGPDSFVITYFRDIMGRKPSLTLELDSHTADAGLETRIEAFLDIVHAYRRLNAKRLIDHRKAGFTPARLLIEEGNARVVTSAGETLSLKASRVTVLIPSMGRMVAEAAAAILQGYGLNAKAAPESDEAILKLGRANTSCKECLPLILTTGTLLSYIHNGRRPDEVLVYFMPTGSGPCRFGQYYIFMEDLVRRLQIPDVAVLALSSDNSYVGMDKNFERHSWWAVIVSDVMEDIRAMLLAAAVDPQLAMSVFDEEWDRILAAMRKADFKVLTAALTACSKRLRGITLKRPASTVPTISLAGEIFARRDSLSRQYLTECLAEKGFATVCAPVAEWVHYCNYLVDHGFNQEPLTTMQKFKLKLRNFFQGRYEKQIKSILARSGLVRPETLSVAAVIEHARPHFSLNLTGEAILTIGGSLSEIISHSCGVIAIGPFGCMPNRLSEAILSETMTAQNKLATDPANPALRAVLTDIDNLPFLAIETDGSPFPQLIMAKLETFLLRAERIHQRMLAGGGHA
jgi:predicted nucleotide-binding protein (sugar kinase/HSP70/actin superfamily)